MKKLSTIAAALFFFIGCSPSFFQPDNGWMIYAKALQPTVCFKQPNASLHWAFCKNHQPGDDRTNCYLTVLLNNDGEIFSNVKVAVYQHNSLGESKVLIQEGEHAGEVFFCPTVQIRKW